MIFIIYRRADEQNQENLIKYGDLSPNNPHLSQICGLFGKIKAIHPQVVLNSITNTLISFNGII